MYHRTNIIRHINEDPRTASLTRQITLVHVTLLLIIATQTTSAAITSENHPKLASTLEQHAAADSDKDGILTFAEYQAWLKSQGPRKRADGGEAGPISTLLANGDLLISDFEENNYGRMKQWGWTVEGESFARDLQHVTKIMKRRTATHSGKYLLSSFQETDATTGRIVSPSFEIELKFIQFQLSGGDHPERICVNLVVEGKVLRTTTGRNRDLFEMVAFDVAALRGRQAALEIVDAHSGLWGHINVDQMVQTDHPTARRVVNTIPTDFGALIGTVQTVDHRRRGPLTINDGRLSVGQQAFDLDGLLLAICENELVATETSGSLRLVNGEIWYGQIIGLANGQIEIQNAMFDRRSVPVDQIASIEFKPGPTSGGEPGTLYRDQGEPIPGKLVWIREKDVTIDCALGIVPIPRQSVQRLVLAAIRRDAEPSQDEVRLVDGSLFRGVLATDGDRLVLNHGTLGALSFQWSTIRYLRRAAAGVSWLDRLEGEIIDRVGPVLPPPAPSVVNSTEPDFLRAIRMMPRTVTRYTLPSSKAERFLRAMLAPIPGCQADVNVQVKIEDRVLWEQQVTASSVPIEVAVDLRRETEFAIEVDYGGRLAFPCGVDWRDAHVLESR